MVSGKDVAGGLGEITTVRLWEDPSIRVMRAPGQPVLAMEKVLYVGQSVAVVVAETREQARDAAEALIIDYEPLPVLGDAFQALKDEAEPLHAELGTNLAMHLVREGGDLDAAFDAADIIVEQRYEVQRLAPAPWETRGVDARHEARRHLLHVRDASPAPNHAR